MTDPLVLSDVHPYRVILAAPSYREGIGNDEELGVLIQSAGLEGATVRVFNYQALMVEIAEQHFDLLLVIDPFGERPLEQTIGEVRELVPGLPVVVLGASASAHSAVQAMRAGASNYLLQEKVAPGEVREAVEDAIHQSLVDRQQDAVNEAERAAERVLRERELQIRGFFDFASVAMALIGLNGNIVRANPALRRLCGYGLEEITRLKLFHLLMQHDQDTLFEGLSLLMTERVEAYDEDVQFRHRSGESIWVRVSFAAISNEDGEVQGYTLHATDIRTRKAAEAELQRSERRFQELLAQAPIGIVETSITGSCRYVNGKWSEVTGVSYSDAVGLGWTKTIHPDDRKRVLKEWTLAVADEREFSAEFRFEKPNGEVIWVSGKSDATRDNDGKVVGYLGTVADITDRHRAEEDLRRTGALLRGVLDSAPFSVIVTSIDGLIREINQGAVDLLGYACEEVVGKPAIELVHEPLELATRLRAPSRGSGQSIPSSMSALVELTKSRTSPEWTYLKKDGTEFPVELAVSEMRDWEGCLYGYVAIANDVTERVRRSNELVKARVEAERATEAKADFLARMSHEIRTPMNSVLGMTEIALQTKLTIEQRGYLELVRGSGQSLLRLIDDILDFSKGEASGLRLERVPFDIRETFAVCLRCLSHQARQKGVELVFRVSREAVTRVVGDPYRLQQILVNLVGNSVKFTSDGEIVVDVSCTSTGSSEELSLYLKVSDTGPGVAKDEQARIFRAFAQEDTRIARRYGGTGLGLAICSQLVELMNGSIWLDSSPGLGSCFHVRLELERDREPLPTNHSYYPAPVEAERILVIEPNTKSREETRAMLEKLGREPDCVSSQREALAKAEGLLREGKRYSVVILDLSYWDERGLQFVQQLEERNGPTRIVCLSPTDHGEEDRWTESYIRLVKPVLPADFARALDEVRTSSEPPRSDGAGPIVSDAKMNRSLKILVAEDNPTNQQVVFAMLRRLGHESAVVEHGQAALDRLDAEDFDVVLMDLQMPMMGGLEAVRALRARETTLENRVPVVALTAQAMPGDREECLRNGMDEYLSKPLDIQALARVLGQVPLSLDRAEKQAEESSTQRASSSPKACSPSVDFGMLQNRIGESSGALEKIYHLFERDSKQLMLEISAQIRMKGPSQNSAATHTIKGMLRNVCALQAAEVAAELEKLIGAGAWENASRQLSTLEKEVLLAAAELKVESGCSHS